MPLQVGIDLVAADDVRNSIDAHGRRYLERVYTKTELRECGSDPALLAARFAAKEALMKALGVSGEQVAWSEIGVAQDSGGRSSLELTGAAAALGERLGLGHIALSMTRERSLAAAIVFAEVSEGQ